MVEIIRTREQLEEIIRRGTGYLYNDFGGQEPKNCPMHAVSCAWVARMAKVKPGTLGIKKFWCESPGELVGHIVALGKIFSFCGSEPTLAHLAQSGSGPAAAARSAAKRPAPAGRPAPAPMRAPATSDGAHYQLSISSPSRGPVDCGSAERLNFEPKDWRLAMRDELRTAVRRLQSAGDEVLHASYASASHETVDAENVLFYNIGMGAFSASSRSGVRFERVYSTPRMPGSTGSWPHLARYMVSALREPFTHWQSGRVLARWEDASSPALGEETKPGEVWLALKRSRFECLGRLVPPTANFGMRIRVRRGAHGPAGATSMLKALLDGVISALHVHDGSNRDEITRRLARMLGAPAAEIGTHLMDASAAVLGSRDLLWLRGANVQWNPADDGLVAAEVLVDDKPGAGGQWSHSGELFEVCEKSAR